MSIPKIIHYCWFGGGPISAESQKCMESWKKYCPDYKIIEWNEQNFDISQNRYAQQAYEAKKYAFVSDYVRLAVLYEYGGIYLDTDVELVRPLDELLELPETVLTETDKKIGQMIADEVPNGATLQLGIGGVPNAVGVLLRDKKDLGLHTEMFTDSMVDLLECGAVTNMKKPINVGKTIATLAWGTKKMYEYMDDNPAFEMHPVDYTNNPYVIGQHDNFISVNACVEIDLFGQVCAESLGTLHYSGSGGQVDFVRGANLSKGGKGFIAMTSTAKNGTVSKVKPVLTPGSIVTTSKNEVDFLVTENNIVRLKGRTASERAKMIISLAAPEFRDELLFEAKKMNLIV